MIRPFSGGYYGVYLEGIRGQNRKKKHFTKLGTLLNPFTIGTSRFGKNTPKLVPIFKGYLKVLVNFGPQTPKISTGYLRVLVTFGPRHLK